MVDLGLSPFWETPIFATLCPPVISWFTKNVRIEKYRYIYHKPLLELCSPTEQFRTGAPPCLCITLCLLHSTTRPRESALAKRVSCFRISSFPWGFSCFFFLGGVSWDFQSNLWHEFRSFCCYIWLGFRFSMIFDGFVFKQFSVMENFWYIYILLYIRGATFPELINLVYQWRVVSSSGNISLPLSIRKHLS